MEYVIATIVTNLNALALPLTFSPLPIKKPPCYTAVCMHTTPRLSTLLHSQQDQWLLWVPVIFGFGIALYFSLPFEPDGRYCLVALVLTLLPLRWAKRISFAFWLLVTTSIVLAGFAAATWRTHNVAAPILREETSALPIEGTVLELQSLARGKRVLLSELSVPRLPENTTPKVIRLKLNTADNGAKPGDRIRTLAVLSPPPEPVIPGGYDFARYAYFEQIGAVGYSVSPLEIITQAADSTTNRWRYDITGRILAALPDTSGHIAAALLVGAGSGIEPTTLDNLRIAGLGHILSISGMHLSLVAAVFFFMARALLACSSWLTLHTNIKKWAAAIAIMGSFIYLLLSGAPVSAQRAFIMTSLVLGAILLDRTGLSLRSIAIAAFLLLLLLPEKLLNPSFQMSFAAVIALVASYEYTQPWFRQRQHYHPLQKIPLYIGSLAASSLVAGAATAMFGVYHFNRFSDYSILANLLAVPLTSFLIMPMGMLSLMLMPIGLEKPAFLLMGWGIDRMCDIAAYFASLPQVIGTLPTPPAASLYLAVLGGLWLCLWKGRLSLFGLLPLAIGIGLSFFHTTPDILIGAEGKLFAAKERDGLWVASSKTAERFTREIWQESYNLAEMQSPKEAQSLHCDSTGCIHTGHVTTAFARQPLALMQDCSHVDILINLTHTTAPCTTQKLTLSLSDLKHNGVHAIYTENGRIRVKSVGELRGKRPWSGGEVKSP